MEIKMVEVRKKTSVINIKFKKSLWTFSIYEEWYKINIKYEKYAWFILTKKSWK